MEQLAEELFAAQGYRGTSIHLIAARAQCSVGHLYNLYGSKLGLYRALMDVKLKSLAQLVQAAARDRVSGEEGLRSLLLRCLAFFENNTAFFRIYSDETGPRVWPSHAPTKEHQDVHRAILEQVAVYIRQAQEEGWIRAEVDPRVAAISILGMAKAHVTEWVLAGSTGSLVERGDRIWDLFWVGLGARRRTE